MLFGGGEAGKTLTSKEREEKLKKSERIVFNTTSVVVGIQIGRWTINNGIKEEK